MQPHEDDHPQASDAVQDISQHRTFALVPQGIFQADIPFRANPRLLNNTVATFLHRSQDCVVAALPNEFSINSYTF